MNRDLRNNRMLKIIRRVPIIVSMLTMLLLIYNMGYISQSDKNDLFRGIYFVTILIGAVSISGRYIQKKTRPRLTILPFDIILFSFLLILIYQYLDLYFLQSSSLFKHLYCVCKKTHKRQFIRLLPP